MHCIVDLNVQYGVWGLLQYQEVNSRPNVFARTRRACTRSIADYTMINFHLETDRSQTLRTSFLWNQLQCTNKARQYSVEIKSAAHGHRPILGCVAPVCDPREERA